MLLSHRADHLLSGWDPFIVQCLKHWQSLLSFLPIDYDFQDMGEVHHLGEHLHDIRMFFSPCDEFLQRQLTCQSIGI